MRNSPYGENGVSPRPGVWRIGAIATDGDKTMEWMHWFEFALYQGLALCLLLRAMGVVG
jgi:hypothetical protein